jgi:hypothetical protein
MVIPTSTSKMIRRKAKEVEVKAKVMEDMMIEKIFLIKHRATVAIANTHTIHPTIRHQIMEMETSTIDRDQATKTLGQRTLIEMVIDKPTNTLAITAEQKEVKERDSHLAKAKMPKERVKVKDQPILDLGYMDLQGVNDIPAEMIKNDNSRGV